MSDKARIAHLEGLLRAIRLEIDAALSPDEGRFEDDLSGLRYFCPCGKDYMATRIGEACIVHTESGDVEECPNCKRPIKVAGPT